MKLTEAVDLFGANGWVTQTVCENYAVMAYDDGGELARSFDRKRGRGSARVSLIVQPDGTIESRLLSKATTNTISWIRYRSARKQLRTLQGL